MTSPEAILALGRLGFYAAAMPLFGVQCFVAILAPVPLGERLAAGAGRALKAASLVAVLSCILSVLATTAMVGDGWNRALDVQTLKALLLDTSVGHALLARTVLALVVILFLLARAGAPRLKMAGSALLLASLSLSGHARMDMGGREAIHVASHVLHLLSAGFWLGSLAILPACLARLRDTVLNRLAKLALLRFSVWGHGAVALALATGAVNTAMILGGWPNWQMPYPWLLLAKIALVATMVGVALLNRYRFVPRLRTGPDEAIANIRFGTYAELVLAAGVLALVAVFGDMEPS